MFSKFLPLLFVLLLIAAFLRGDFALTLIYLVIGALVAGLWWCRQALAQVEAKRQFSSHAFLGETVKQFSIGDPSWPARGCEV